MGTIVRGDGPLPCPVFLCGERPGHDEAIEGRAFVGPAGQELWYRLFRICNLSRDDVYTTNLVKTASPLPPSRAEIQRDAPLLLAELTRCKPSIIVTVGYHAARHFLPQFSSTVGDYFAGLPFAISYGKVTRRSAIVVPVVHSSAALRVPERYQNQLSRDLRMVREVLEKRAHPFVARRVAPYQVGLASIARHMPLGLDTEYDSTTGRLQCVTLSTSGNEAAIVELTDKNAIVTPYLKEAISSATRVISHSAKAEYHSLHTIGIDLTRLHVDDTMLKAYLLNLPQSLKVLAFRELGWQLDEYDDLVLPLDEKRVRLTLEVAHDRFVHIHRQHQALLKRAAARHRDNGERAAQSKALARARYGKAPTEKGQEITARVLTSLKRIVEAGDGAVQGDDRERGTRGEESTSLVADEAGRENGKERSSEEREETPRDSLRRRWSRSTFSPLVPLPSPVSWSDLPQESRRAYALTDAIAHRTLDHHLSRMMVEQNLSRAYAIDRAVLPFLVRNEQIGLAVDVDRLHSLSKQFKRELAEIHDEIDALAGKELNPHSSPQVSDVLFYELGITPTKHTPSHKHYATSDKYLKARKSQHEIIPLILSARQLKKYCSTYCVVPSTRVLTSQLKWKAAGELREGDDLLAFDEHPVHSRQWRKWKHSKVLAAPITRKECYEIEFADSTTVTCTGDHHWLARKNVKAKLEWVRTDQLRSRRWLVVKPLDVWTRRGDFNAGYISAAFDGEGNLSRSQSSSGFRMGFAQKRGRMMNRMKRLLREEGFKASCNKREVTDYLSVCRSRDVLRLLGEFRPIRLLEKFQQSSSLPNANFATDFHVRRLRYVGVQDVVALQTDSHTFVAEGFASHNTDRLPNLLRNGRYHPDWKYTRTATGRLAEAIILLIPKHDPLAKEEQRVNRALAIRDCFHATDGHALVSVDLSQIELRCMAHLSQDRKLLRAYERDEDIHANVAHELLGAPKRKEDQDESKHRLPAKCFHPDTEVLTHSGWKRIVDLVQGERIIQAHPERDGNVSLSWTVPTEVYATHHDSKQLVHLSNEGIDIRVTPDHRMLGWHASGEWFVSPPKPFATGAIYWANSGVLRGQNRRPKANRYALRLAVALQADGSITEWKSVKWGFSKKRKADRLRTLLNVARIPFTEAIHKNGKNGTVMAFSVKAKHARSFVRQLDRKMLPWSWLDLPEWARRIVLDEARYWDSHSHPNEQTYSYCSLKRQNIDVLQALAAITGQKARIGGNILSVKPQSGSKGGYVNVRTTQYMREVACLSVQSSFVLVRDRGVTLICGQTLNFGVINGMTEYGMLDQLHENGQLSWTIDDVRELLKGWWKIHTGVSHYWQVQIAHAKRTGFVKDLFGARRWIEAVHSTNDEIRSTAERQCLCPIQMTADRISKVWNAKIWKRIIRARQREEQYCEPWIRVHDNTILETDKRAANAVYKEMIALIPDLLCVPTTAAGHVGERWGSV